MKLIKNAIIVATIIAIVGCLCSTYAAFDLYDIKRFKNVGICLKIFPNLDEKEKNFFNRLIALNRGCVIGKYGRVLKYNEYAICAHPGGWSLSYLYDKNLNCNCCFDPSDYNQSNSVLRYAATLYGDHYSQRHCDNLFDTEGILALWEWCADNENIKIYFFSSHLD
ncbi:MAG: hypothetical protein LBR79_03740 [Oscillospiraceae bacterium]|jgi:hypothetical protein|nr:hypothetical protein [Oscillospiraceae bacterium]